MEKKGNILLRYPRLVLTVLLAAIITGAFVSISRCTRNDSLTIETNQKIDVTPQVVESLRSIGQWEFLSITDEELVDTVRKNFWGTDQLVRIYYGTLRLGIDMTKMGDGAIVAKGDTVSVSLPPVTLLDDHFIDETRTRAFHESGKWTDADRQAMYRKAYRQMKARCLTKANMKSAEENALRQFHTMMEQMGFNQITVRFHKQ